MTIHASAKANTATVTPPTSQPARSGVLQRTCACGSPAGPTGECAPCRRQHALGRPLQAKLRINQPGDRYEQEADRVAEQVMRMPEPGLQRKPT